MDRSSTATLEASAAFDRWRKYAAGDHHIAATAVAVLLRRWLAAGVTPEWTAGERASFEAWCRGDAVARARPLCLSLGARVGVPFATTAPDVAGGDLGKYLLTRSAFEAMDRAVADAGSRGVDGSSSRPGAEVRVLGAPGVAREAGDGPEEVTR